MAGASIEIQASDVLAGLQQLKARVGYLQPVFADIGEYLLRSHRDRFEAQKTPDGEQWAELSPQYLAEKPYNQDKILVLDGELMGGLRYQTEPDALEFGTDRPYGATHQFGRDEVNIKARPFLGLSGDDEREVLEIIYRHLQDAI